MDVHRNALCTIEMAAEGNGSPCPEERCAYWDKGCILAGVRAEVAVHPNVAQLLLLLRRELEYAKLSDDEVALRLFHQRLAAGREWARLPALRSRNASCACDPSAGVDGDAPARAGDDGIEIELDELGNVSRQPAEPFDEVRERDLVCGRS